MCVPWETHETGNSETAETDDKGMDDQGVSDLSVCRFLLTVHSSFLFSMTAFPWLKRGLNADSILNSWAIHTNHKHVNSIIAKRDEENHSAGNVLSELYLSPPPLINTRVASLKTKARRIHVYFLIIREHSRKKVTSQPREHLLLIPHSGHRTGRSLLNDRRERRPRKENLLWRNRK